MKKFIIAFCAFLGLFFGIALLAAACQYAERHYGIWAAMSLMFVVAALGGAAGIVAVDKNSKC